MCWQLSPWWEVGAELEGLEPEPGASWGFSSAHWPPPRQGWGQRHRGWSRSPEEVGFLPGVMAVSALVWGIDSGPEGLRLYFFSDFTLSLMCLLG